MTMERRRAAVDHNALSTAWRDLVRAIGKGDAVALRIGQPPSRVSEYGAPGSERSPSIAAVLELESDVGLPIVTAALAALHGYRLVPMDAAGDPASLEPLAFKVLSEVGEAYATLGAALADKRLSFAERDRLEREFGDVARAAERVVAALRGGK